MSAPCGPEPWHGTPNGYSNHGCRGDACREAKVAYNRERLGREKRSTTWAGQGSYYLNPAYVPDTMTRGELLAARGYPESNGRSGRLGPQKRGRATALTAPDRAQPTSEVR